ncbi:hypothetical protein BDQ94DRAFT_132897 [Aspergillus welwitschiae]|uniref:Uncharacterized protein n=1 Tax=Aspergillus welwitschiae TaxID=1341132 RepID=A0A3F3QJ16_9EURO|nr:hypothetical protein BDQ94DRAFT_132897 [Aspergillus welwitschiae]RDH39334.1 hypothetical protein BDQ94DRAFT_132897 [Aspergillus welwitschiae]
MLTCRLSVICFRCKIFGFFARIFVNRHLAIWILLFNSVFHLFQHRYPSKKILQIYTLFTIVDDTLAECPSCCQVCYIIADVGQFII